MHLKGTVLCVLVERQLIPDPVPRPCILVLHPEHKQSIHSIHNLIPDRSRPSEVRSPSRERVVLVLAPCVPDVSVPRVLERVFDGFAPGHVGVQVRVQDFWEVDRYWRV